MLRAIESNIRKNRDAFLEKKIFRIEKAKSCERVCHDNDENEDV